MRTNHKIVTAGTALLLAMGLGIAAVGTTSAYFSDTNTGGAITVSAASVATISVDVDGNPTTTPALDFAGLLPGATQTKSFTITNTGTSAQDVWVQFPDQKELQDFSMLLKDSAALEILVDGALVYTSDPAGASAQAADWKLPDEILLAQDLAPGQSADVAFAMTLDATTTTADAQASSGLPVTMHYNIVATQPGIDPGA